MRRGLVDANPAADLELPRKEKPLPDFLTDEEAMALMGACDVSDARGLRDRAFLELLYSSGLRRTEALRLHMHNVDRVRGIVHVVKGKGHKDRYYPIGSRGLAWLERYEEEVRAVWCRDALETRIFLCVDGQPLPNNRLGGRITRLKLTAGITKHGSCHLFRHGFATGLVEAGCDLRLIAAMMGHDDLDSTMIYTHVGIGKLVAAHRLYHPSEQAAKEGSGAAAAAGCPAPAGPQDAAP